MIKFSKQDVWHEYYDAFSYFNTEDIRYGCHAQRMLHPGGSDKAVVLVHGLTDSPYSMLAVAHHFYEALGYDVYLPLLQLHGLKDSGGMVGSSIDEWKANVRFAVEAAGENGRRVSAGGLSTGGALCFHLAATDSLIAGELYLFSAAFGLYGSWNNILSPIVENFLKLPWIPLFASRQPLVGENPYRYERVPLVSARELVSLIEENRQILREIKEGRGFNHSIFSVWSEADKVVRYDLLEKLGEFFPKGRYCGYAIPKRVAVKHAAVVLACPVYGISSPPGALPMEPANPHFYKIVDELSRFERSTVTG